MSGFSSAPSLLSGIFDQTAARAALGLTIGTSGAAVPLLNGANTWSAAQTNSVSLLLGGGTPTGNPYQFQSVKNADPSTLGADSRFNLFQDILTYSVDTNNTWEGLMKLTFINGPGAANGEINGIHSYMEYEPGSKAAAVENFEASTLNNGQITGIHAQYLAVFHNGPSGTAVNARGLRLGLVNDNTTGAVIGDWAAIENSPKSGAGSMPTAYRFIKNADPDGAINTLGGIAINTLTIPPQGLLDVHGVDSSAATVAFSVKNSSNQFGLIVQNDMSVLFANNLAKILPTGELVAASIDYGSTGFLVAKTGSKFAFFGGTPVIKQTVTGSRGGNAAVASLLTLLATAGLLTDSSS